MDHFIMMTNQIVGERFEFNKPNYNIFYQKKSNPHWFKSSEGRLKPMWDSLKPSNQLIFLTIMVFQE